MVAPTVLVVEDHILLAQSLTLALEADGFTAQRTRALDAQTILDEVRALEPDVVLLDLDLGDGADSGLSLIRPIADTGTRVIMLTGITNRMRLAECVEAGAIGILQKSEPFERLVEQVRTAVEQGTLLAKSERDTILAELRLERAAERGRLAAFERLTPREQQVLAALMEGKTAESIAAEWVVSINTVRAQIRSLLQKLDVNSQLAAVGAARRAGWRPDSG